MTRADLPTSVRLSPRINDFVTGEARRTHRTKSYVLESLIDEAARTRQFPGIAFRGRDSDRRAWVIGTGMDVWEIVQAVQENGSTAALASASHVSPSQIALALAYYERFPEDIDEAIVENRTAPEALRQRYPHIQIA